jgi:hypothetical protein
MDGRGRGKDREVREGHRLDERKEFGERRQKWDCDGSTLAAVFCAVQETKPHLTIAFQTIQTPQNRVVKNNY